MLLSLKKRFCRHISHYTCNSVSTELLKLLAGLLASAEAPLNKALEGTNHSVCQRVYPVSSAAARVDYNLLSNSLFALFTLSWESPFLKLEKGEVSGR